jgi:predicted HTH transcriptional regulator
MGTGIVRMKNAAKEANVAEPEFEFTGFFKVTFKRTSLEAVCINEKQAETDRNGQKRAETNSKQAVNKQKQAETSSQKHFVCALIEDSDKISSSEIAARIGLSESRTRALLKEMTDEGLIEKVGSYRGAYYILKP